MPSQPFLLFLGLVKKTTTRKSIKMPVEPYKNTSENALLS